MTKPAKPKNNGGTKVKNRHNKAKTGYVNPLAKYRPEEQDAYSKLLLAEDQYEKMQERVLNRGHRTNLPRMSMTVLEAMVLRHTPDIDPEYAISAVIANTPSYERAQFTEWCEPLVKHREYMNRLRSKCRRILDAMEAK